MVKQRRPSQVKQTQKKNINNKPLADIEKKKSYQTENKERNQKKDVKEMQEAKKIKDIKEVKSRNIDNYLGSSNCSSNNNKKNNSKKSCNFKSLFLMVFIFFIVGILISFSFVTFFDKVYLGKSENIAKNKVINGGMQKDIAGEDLINQNEIAGGFVSKEEAREKVLDFIVPQIPEGVIASVAEIISESGLYKMTIIFREEGPEGVQAQEIIIYLTKDGTLLFPEVINLEEVIKEQETRSRCEKFQAELTPERKEKIAKCLADKGFRVYMADWCPFCRQQKEFFGEAAKYLPSVDCYNPEGERGNLNKCPGIAGVPLWKDGEGNKLPGGMIQIRILVEKSGCNF